VSKPRIAPLLFIACLSIATPALAGHVLHVPQDFPTIQAAVDAAQSGDAVLVAAGTYAESVTISGKQHLELRSAGNATIDATGLGVGVDISGAQNIRVDKLTIKSDQIGVRIAGSSVVTVDHCTIASTGSVGVSSADGDQTSIVSNKISSDGTGVTLASGDSTIRGNTVQAFSVGIAVESGHNNLVDSNKVPDPAFDGIVVAAAADLATVRHNLISNPNGGSLGTGAGIRLQAPDCVVDRNTVSRGSSDGIDVESGATNAQVLGNFVDHPLGASGISVVASTCLVKGNRVRDAVAGAAITVDAPGTGNRLESNKVQDASNGGIVVKEGADSTTLVNNRILRADKDGISVSAKSCSATGDVITASVARGLFVGAAGGGGTFTGEKVNGSGAGSDAIEIDGGDNTLSKCKATHAGGSGFLVTGAANTLDHCVSVAAAGDGIELPAGAAGNTLSHCTVTHAGTDAFDVEATFCTFDGCRSGGAVHNGFEVCGTNNSFTKCSASGSGNLDLHDPAAAGTTNSYVASHFPKSSVP
jgi:hypothetical protein